MERTIERLFFASRWLLAPVYLGLSVALVVLGIKFFQELIHAVTHIMSLTEADAVLSLLALVDLAMVAGLIVMVMFSGYENFVSKLDVDGAGGEKLSWLGKLDAGSLKLKVAASIVAISSIHLLRQFMLINSANPAADASAVAEAVNREPTTQELMWYVIIHMTFVFSALLMGVLDRITAANHRHKD